MSRHRRLFSYVVDHDFGREPNPFDGICTLACCKYRKPGSRKRNIVELAEVGDWIVGTGGANEAKSAGNGKLLYAMRVGKKLRLGVPCSKPRYEQAILMSQHFYYFGREAPDIPPQFKQIEKKGRSHKSRFEIRFIESFVDWLEKKFRPGKHGAPCISDMGLSSTKQRRKRASRAFKGGC